ncbi:nucleotidyl transferase [Methylorubrum populi]|uniref:Nucleotidyl transferase n=1 Tax=Methylorubrum populi TaxID=223967 RepID=A0A160PIL3_9HYPH|nr:nucleotidyltransferase family protein [Methylorubrum populi]BAU92776.1 nucleotidyl transferase [Methylorubrum populi]
MKAVIQAGGRGTRLMPYTSVLPKPLMPIGAKPVLELLVKWLRRNAIEELYITTGYLGHLIRSFCGDGRQWGLHIVYTEETEPLGTIGALTLLERHLDETFLVLNGDVLTDLSLRTFTGIHRAHGHPFTIATACRSNKLDFGVIEDEDGVVTSFSEKPVLTNSVSMGIYCMEPEILDHIPRGMPFGADDLAHCLLAKNVPIHVYKHQGLWLDIGRVEDFHKAQDIRWEEHAPSLMVVGA